MKYKVVIAFVVLLVASQTSFAQQNYSIPIDNWTYGVIQQLQTRGFLLDLSPGFKPYRRMEVARALEKLHKKVDVARLPQSDRWLIEKLDKAFSYEARLLKAERANPDTSFVGARFAEEVFFNFVKGDYQTFKYADKLEFRPLSRTEFGFDIGNHLSLYTDATVNQTLKDDTLYTGFTKFGLDALHQQAYLQYSSRYVDFTFGRDYLSWGYGNDGTVLISTTPGAYDMMSLFVKTHVVKFNWFVAQLNPMPEFTPDTNSYMPFPTVGVPDPLTNRYLTGSRFEFNIANKVFLGAYQAATFGGPNAPIDLQIINPLRVTYETENNSHKDLNAFLGADMSVFWPENFNFYGDLMIDDWQVDHKTKSDLKPNLYAFDLGVKAANFLSGLGLNGSDVSLQYRMAANRTYNEYDWTSFQKLMLRNYPIASPFGDDYWNLDLRLSQWFTYDWQLQLEIMHLEHGSENMYGPYSMPWLTNPNITVQTGYHEPFPYGTVQVTDLFGASLMYQPQDAFYGKATVSYAQNHNFDYQPGVNKGVLSFILTFYYNIATTLAFR